MQSDDLGQFPTPQAANTPVVEPTPPATTLLEDINTPPEVTAATPVQPETPPVVTPSTDTPSTFEETPEVIPSATPATDTYTAPEVFPEPSTVIPAAPPAEASALQHLRAGEPEAATPPQEVPATVVPKGGPSFGPLILIGLLLVAGIGLAASVFLFSQSQQLKGQLADITQTLQTQQTVLTPTPTASAVEAPTPSLTPSITITPIATVSPTLTITPTATATAIITPSTTGIIMPLSAAPAALRVAINHQPNAQLILIKTENATSLTAAITKYYFRQNLTTKKYFYVSIDSQGQSQVVDTAIYVTPDNNIPSLNDMVLGNTLGIDFDQALKIATDLCSDANVCATATVKAQYIKSGDIVIWQLSFDPQDTSKDTLVMQINATTSEVLYKSAGFK